MEKTTLLIMTLNEIDGVKFILPKIQKDYFEQIVVLDGGSTDGTIEWCKNNGYDVYVQTKKGIRHAYLEFLPYIKGDIILTMSPDGNCDVKYLPEILRKIHQGYDLVIGSRYLDNAKSADDDIITGFGNWFFTKTVNLLFCNKKFKYTDSMVIYRAFTKSIIYDLDLHQNETYLLPEKLFGTVISWEPIMSVRAAKCQKRIAEVAVGEPERIGGKRKLQIFRWGAAYYFQFLRELWFWKKFSKKISAL